MSRHDELLIEAVLERLGDARPRRIVGRLWELGLIDRGEAERLAIRREVERLTDRGMPRTEAFIEAAERFCCSYEKARNAYYRTKNQLS